MSNRQGLKTLWRRRNRQLFTYGASLVEKLAYWGHRAAEQISSSSEVKVNGPVSVPCNIWAICGRKVGK